MPTRRLGQGRRVVDAVARHRHAPSLPLKLADDLPFLRRQDLGAHLVDAQPPCHRLRRRPAVAGQHDDAQPVGMDRVNRVRGGRFDRIGNGDHAGRPAVDRHEHHGLAVSAERVCGRIEHATVDAAIAKQRHVSEHDGSPVDRPHDSLSSHRLKVGGRRNRDVPVAGASDNGCRQWMLTALLEAGGQTKHFVLGESGDGLNANEARTSFRQRSCLVDDESIDALQSARALPRS